MAVGAVLGAVFAGAQALSSRYDGKPAQTAVGKLLEKISGAIAGGQQPYQEGQNGTKSLVTQFASANYGTVPVTSQTTGSSFKDWWTKNKKTVFIVAGVVTGIVLVIVVIKYMKPKGGP